MALIPPPPLPGHGATSLARHGAAHSSEATTTPPRVKPITFSGFGGDQRGKKI